MTSPVTGSPAGTTVAITSVNALSCAAEIKELFRRNQRPEFPDFFDRTYAAAAASGATSWIGRDPAGGLAMHIACFPRRYRLGSRSVTAGLMVNLMVAPRYRKFFPSLALVRQLVQDARARGTIDLLYADPNEESRALLRGTRFVTAGHLQRYVFPVRSRSWPADLAVRSWHALLRLLNPAPRGTTIAVHDASLFAADAVAAPFDHPSRFSACHDRALFVSRLPGYPTDRDWWVTVHRGSSAGVEGALLVRGPDASGLGVLHVVRLAPTLPLAALMPGLVAELRRRDCGRLQVSTVAESDLARTLRRCGFVPRAETLPLFALPLTPLGEECIRSVRNWEITELECDR